MRALELHASAKTIQRSHGRSSVAASAYRSGTKLYDERTGITHDYTRKSGVEFSRIYLPENAPDKYRDREVLWNAVEAKENRSNSCTARELEVGFPYEFHAMQRREAGDQIARELMNRYGVAVDIAFHKPNANNDERNFHAHILFTDRGFDASTKDRWAKTKYRDLSNDKMVVDGEKTTRGQQEILSLRAFTEGVMNKIAERDNIALTVEHLSFKARDIDREPQIHLGSVANDMEKQGKQSERGTQNKVIIDWSKKFKEAKQREEQQQKQDSFDEYAGKKRAELQSWRRDQIIEHDRRIQGEQRRLEEKLDNFYNKTESKSKAELKTIEKKLNQLKTLDVKTVQQAKDLNEERERLVAEKKMLNGMIERKEEQRGALRIEHEKRTVEMQKRHKEAERILEKHLDQKRREMEEGKSDDGKSGEDDGKLVKAFKKAGKQGYKSLSDDFNTARKVERKRLNKTFETASKSHRPKKTGDKTYSQESMLRDNFRKVVSRNGDKPEKANLDHTPPRGPSRER